MLFGQDIRCAAESDTTGEGLFAVSMTLRTCIKSETKANEQFNSLIRVLNEQSRNIGLDLLSARACIKKALGVGTRGVSLKWSALRPAAQRLLEDVVEHHEKHNQVAWLLQRNLKCGQIDSQIETPSK